MTKPHNLLWLTIPVVALLALAGRNSSIAWQSYDTYYIIAAWQIYIALGLCLALAGLVYKLMLNRKLINWMTILHVLITISTCIAIPIAYAWEATDYTSLQSLQRIKLVSAMSILLFILAQSLFLINIAVSLLRNR